MFRKRSTRVKTLIVCLFQFQVKVHTRRRISMRICFSNSDVADDKICFMLDGSTSWNLTALNGCWTPCLQTAKSTISSKETSVQRSFIMLRRRSVRESHARVYQIVAQVMRNLNVVLTTNPSLEGLKNRASSSPALSNCSVHSWFRDWNGENLIEFHHLFSSFKFKL